MLLLGVTRFQQHYLSLTYFAEMEDLAKEESRKFMLSLPDLPRLLKAIVNIMENAQGS